MEALRYPAALSLWLKSGPTFKFLAPHLQKSFDAEEILTRSSTQHLTTKFMNYNGSQEIWI